jgi:hypothetical protein
MAKRTVTRGSLKTLTPEEENRTRQRIAERAYELFQARGRVDGYDIDDWLQAERQIQAGQPKVRATARAGRGKSRTSQARESHEAPQ